MRTELLCTVKVTEDELAGRPDGYFQLRCLLAIFESDLNGEQAVEAEVVPRIVEYKDDEKWGLVYRYVRRFQMFSSDGGKLTVNRVSAGLVDELLMEMKKDGGRKVNG